VNVPVSVGGMDVAPGEIVHMDENGAVKFPAQHLEAVLNNSKAMLAKEAEQVERFRTAKSAADLRRVSSGSAYAAPEKK